MKSKFLITLLAVLMSFNASCDQEDSPTMIEPEVREATELSQYVTVSDGTRLAVSVYLPEDLKTDEKVPTLFVLTRYGRVGEVNGIYRAFTQRGYAVLSADVRGSSASFGRRPGEYSPTEVQDAKDLVDWAVGQDWCDGNIGAFGVSYTGTTAELLTATGHEAVKAVVPGWSDFDVYDSPVRPFGALASGFISTWSEYVGAIDQGHGATKVAEDSDGSLLEQAIGEHAANQNIFEAVRTGLYKDSKMGEFTYQESCPLYWKKEIEASNVPMLVFASWLDAGSAEGALRRFQHFSNPQKLIIMPDNHGANSHASPYKVENSAVAPSMSGAEVVRLHLDFFDTYLKGEDKGVDAWPAIRYYNFSEEAYQSTAVWPPAGINMEKYYFGANDQLTTSTPTSTEGKDQYAVDFSVSTGVQNRWTTQLGEDIAGLHDPGAMDAKMQTYTSVPLESDLQLSGTPVVRLHLASTHEDGLVMVYLEDVDENGQSRYLTEGGLRLIHRKETQNPFSGEEPYHSFLEADAAPMPVDQDVAVNFHLLPTSVLLKAGHRIRIAIAGADSPVFDRIPEQGDPVWEINRSATYPSLVELPVRR